ncbi:hypothetical protein XELAEV_18007658mg [Xenopus laevis]|uniref:Ig-like domain-containing protein n=1 Tax=Xenopus laevis TaxID=8355 RepID=A0A974E1K1_XENLA|nr:hypothetical protein XELAEV_18007658mg [Xenopus laevis]
MGSILLGTFFSVTTLTLVAYTVSPGDTARLPCAFKYKIENTDMKWYQFRHENRPRFVYRYHTASSQERGPGIPERFSVEPNLSKNVWELIISGVQVEDDAIYYCNVWSDPSHSDTK